MFIYCQIRCIALRVMQASKGFWVYLLRQSFELGARSMQITMLNALAQLGQQKQN